MSNIGYAVFGMPKGLAVISNGLFKSLNLDKSLYLNSAHVVLEKGEQALMIRRIPSNLNKLEQKDALLIALYENALQHGENRAGGFVGSSICFKDKMPNAEEMISGLVYLFSKMKESVDEDNRFKSIDDANWNVSLPDANRKYGLENTKLNYAPISSTNNNFFIKLNSLNKEAASLLYNFALNRSFHSVDYIYASTSNSVIYKMKLNGFSQLPFAELFNYSRYLNFVKDRLVKDDEKLKFINKNAADLQNKISIDENEANRLGNTITNSKKELNRIEEEIKRAKNQLAQESSKIHQNRSSQPIVNRGNDSAMSNTDANNYKALKETVSTAASKVRKYTNINFENHSSSNIILDKSYVDEYFKDIGKRKKTTLTILSILTVLVITFVSLYIFKGISLKKYIADTEQKELIINDKKAQIETANKKAKEFLDKLEKFQKGSATANHIEFKKVAGVLLENFIKGVYDKNNEEHRFIVDHKWEFWEFNYRNDQLVNKLRANSQKTYFITLENEIKPLTPYLKWNGEDKIGELLEDYKNNNNNDIYQNIDSEILMDSDLIESHFKYVIEKENGNLEDLKEGQKIKLPFFNNK
jgi:peptidoglycan hydrolase CwlO-like protein